MHRPNAQVSLADLAAAGIRLRPYEAVTLVRELALQVSRGDVAGVPSSHVVRLSPSGSVSVEGPVAAGGRPVVRAAQLLDSLLPASDAGPQFRVPGGLKLVLARALGTLDLPPFGSLDAFAEALGRFAATDPAATVANLVVTWGDLVASKAPEPVEPAPPVSAQVEPFVASPAADVRAHLAHETLTVSDIRRARRATGLALAQVAERSRIPVPLLRQLEWGYLANWPAGHYGRTQLVRYAKAAGLDEKLVVSTVVPLIDELDRARPAAAPQPVSIPRLRRSEEPVSNARPQALAAAPAVTPAEAPVRGRRRRIAALAALAIPAALAIGLLPAWWSYSARPDVITTPPATRTQVAGTSGGSVPPVAAPAAEPRPPAGVATERAAVDTKRDAAATEPAEPIQPPAASSDGAVESPFAAAEDASGDGAAAYRLAADRKSFSPSFASAGSAVFYHAQRSDSSALVRADTDGDGSVLKITRIVDDAANNFHVRPSPDGGRIAFDSDRDGVRGVYVADGDGKHVRRVSGDGYAAVPSWSPDGRTLAFVRAEGKRPAAPERDVWNLWTLDLATNELRRITSHAYGQPWGGSWFPDGRQIAYSHEDRVIVRNLDTGADRVFVSPIKGRQVRTPAVSPDGRRIMFQVRHNGAWLLELPGGAMRRVLEDASAEEYTWAPDGKRVAYHSSKSGTWGVWVMAPR